MAITKFRAVSTDVSSKTSVVGDNAKRTLERYSTSQSVLTSASEETIVEVPSTGLDDRKVVESPGQAFDIEHTPVADDPRAWSPLRKNVTLALVASASLIAGLAANIQNPSVEEIQRELHATSSQFSMSISMFILMQGFMPLLWSAISEVKGRKLVYILSLALFTLGTIVVALSQDITIMIGFRCLQAAGSSAVISLGAASLVDIFEPEERGAKMGIYYMAPLLGPSLGPLLGGILSSFWDWRAGFWFLALLGAISLSSFVFFFRDTFRVERSLVCQEVLRKKSAIWDAQPTEQAAPAHSKSVPKVEEDTTKSLNLDLEKGNAQKSRETNYRVPPFTVSITDVNPLKPLWRVVRRLNNLLVLSASGLLFAFGFHVSYTIARSLSINRHFEPLSIGLVTLCYGAGSALGSLFGGRFSDRQLAKVRALNGGHGHLEMRLQSTFSGLVFLPLFCIALGWLSFYEVHITAICVFLFLVGFCAIWISSSILAYIVDANNGRSSTAAAANSASRGFLAFMAIQIAVPLQDEFGDGWLYTVWGSMMILVGCLVLLVWRKGTGWRLPYDSDGQQ